MMAGFLNKLGLIPWFSRMVGASASGLSRLPESEIASWLPRAIATTCIACPAHDAPSAKAGNRHLELTS
jgi:hypothetical protein